ncbi:unnamed protein product [Cuscuta campestris]|uniref:cytokinin riboside 5'-monophosphate phosphoribohydrolase n=1 Tax=Cuscuta campestris TaxID=132261 RepID=A0A484MMX1_9ASTE|nr:unnamed protein product [Cuscuta campestris]
MATTVDLGRELVRQKIRLTYGGGNVGLQGAVASTVYTNGGIVRGFIPGYIAARQVYGPTYGAEYTVSSNYYKHFEMNHVVEAFIVLPGGIDTMEGLPNLLKKMKGEELELLEPSLAGATAAERHHRRRPSLVAIAAAKPLLYFREISLIFFPSCEASIYRI